MCVYIFACMQPVVRSGLATGRYAYLVSGWVLSEIVRCVTSRDIASFVSQEIIAPLRIHTEMFFPIPKAVLDYGDITERRGRLRRSERGVRRGNHAHHHDPGHGGQHGPLHTYATSGIVAGHSADPTATISVTSVPPPGTYIPVRLCFALGETCYASMPIFVLQSLLPRLPVVFQFFRALMLYLFVQIWVLGKRD